MATTIDKNVTRRAPEITDSEGRPLEVTLNEKNGGTVALRFVGLRSDPLEVSLKTLAKAAALASEGEDLNVQPGWEVELAQMMTTFQNDLQALLARVKGSSATSEEGAPEVEPAVEVETDLDDL